MSLAVHVALEGVRIPLAASRAAEISRRVLRSEGIADALISIAFVSANRIASLNRSHLHRSGATDVIAFGFVPAARTDPIIGDISIAPAIARRNAQALKLPIREELLRLVVHGTLHVLGYDHPDGEDRIKSDMWLRQELILRRAAISKRPSK